MAIKLLGTNREDGTKSYQCANADIAGLPIDAPDGSTCMIVDTGSLKIIHEGTWYDL